MTRNFSNYTLSGTSHEFLTSYAKRIEDYITANNLPKTYSDDIFDRLFEKLNTFQSQGNIKDADVIRVVNDI